MFVYDADAARQRGDGQAPLDEGLRVWFPDGDEIRLQGRRVEQIYSRTVDSVMTAQWTRRYLYDGYQLIVEALPKLCYVATEPRLRRPCG